MFVRLDQPSTIKRSFSKTLFKPEEFETPAFRFRVDGKHFKTTIFENDGVISLTEFSPDTNLKLTVNVAFFKNFSGVAWT